MRNTNRETCVMCKAQWLDRKVSDYKKVYKEDVIKQSDTIEELCDRFIAETEDTVKFWVESTLKNAKIYCGIKNIYGAIWTSRGL